MWIFGVWIMLQQIITALTGGIRRQSHVFKRLQGSVFLSQ
jgi:hypothetical protein